MTNQLQNMQAPEVESMDPENYRNFFRALFWSGSRKRDRKQRSKMQKKDKLKRTKSSTSLTTSYAPILLGNPSHFAVYSAVRRSVLTRWKYLKDLGVDSDDSDNDEPSALYAALKVPKITGIGLRAIFALITKARNSDPAFCEHVLQALLDVLQGHAPEELSQEPAEMISNLHAMLVEIAGGSVAGTDQVIPSTLTSMSSTCLVALSVARGETEMLLDSIAHLIMAQPALSNQFIQVPINVTTLQRSVQVAILGASARNIWLNHGVPTQSLFSSFPIDLPSTMTSGPGDLIVKSLVSDGCYLYLYTSKGLLKIGSGYGNSIRQHVYLYKSDFFLSDRHGWLGFCKNKLYVRIGRRKTEIYDVDMKTLETKNVIKLDLGHPPPAEPKSAIFSDGNMLGLIVLNNEDSLMVKMYDLDVITERLDGTYNLAANKEFTVQLLRRKVLVLGRAQFEDTMVRRVVDLDAPVAIQLEDNDDDPLVSICAGQDFGLLTTASGKVYYTGKTGSLGYKLPNPQSNKWTLMKESAYNRCDPNAKKCKVIQVAVGHEGTHAILVLDDGTALFAGVARRGEDGDGSNKPKRAPKPTRPKKIIKAEGHYIVYAACNFGTTALVTKLGELLMFGKDTQHCDATGMVTALKSEKIVQVALGKAHTVALTEDGQVYTFGINNRGQCGREFGYTKEKVTMLRRPYNISNVGPKLCGLELHTWVTEYCKVCILCLECTGFSNSCQCAALPSRIARENCGCGEGDSGCSTCGVCRRCAEEYAMRIERASYEYELASDASQRADSRTVSSKTLDTIDTSLIGSESDREASAKMNSLTPARVTVPGAHRVRAVAAGLHHTVLCTQFGEVLTFGSNQFGQLGAGDLVVHHRIVRVRVPRASHIAAGSNHTAILTKAGEILTFGSYQRGALGRPRVEERGDRGPIWHALPARVPRIGPRYATKGIWLAASGDQTFAQLSQALIKTDTLFSSTITANANSIVILPNRTEHAFKCVTINKADGSCTAWTGPEQVDFVHSLACLDPHYDLLWCFVPKEQKIQCYNIQTFDSHKIQKCRGSDSKVFTDNDYPYPNYGNMRRLEDFKNAEQIEVFSQIDDKVVDDKPTVRKTFQNMSILNQEVAIPFVSGYPITRMHAALHLLGCLDSLNYARDNKLSAIECKREEPITPILPCKEDYVSVNRFVSNGGGWGYSGHSVEAIRFMSDSDIMCGGIGLFGGRGDYTAKARLYDLGPEGGDQEGEGDLLAETEEIIYECGPKEKYPVLFNAPIPIYANRWYVAWASINGPSSDCGSAGQTMVINDEVGFHFKTSKKANNGTDVNAGQIPTLLYSTVAVDHPTPIKHVDTLDPVVTLTRNISRKVTVPCFRSLIVLLNWSWSTFKDNMLTTNGMVPLTYHKLILMRNQKRVVYVIRVCLRLVKSYINDVYPKNYRKRNSHEHMSYFEAIADVRNIIQTIMADVTPTCSMLPRKPGRTKMQITCYVSFALQLCVSVLNECHDTITSCFHAFFPTPVLKWNQICSLLSHVHDGKVPSNQVRELTATCAALCLSRSLRDVLQYVVPLTQSTILLQEVNRPENRLSNRPDLPPKSATVPRSARTPRPPPIPPRAGSRDRKPSETPLEPRGNFADWHLLDVVLKLLDVVIVPIKQNMMTRQCGQPHDHGEIRQNNLLATFCCKLIARIVSELTHGVTNIREDLESNGTVTNIVTPSRFMRINQARAWNTGNGSPDAICFTVDKPGLQLVGVGVYGGTGNYDYELELLNDVRQFRGPNDDSNLSHCWVSLEVVHGAYSTADCQNDITQLFFDRPVPLREDIRYAIRLCNHGARTVNGDCGIPSIKGPDGTTFRYSSCSLSFNGTSLARGQIPCLIYSGSSKQPQSSCESSDTMLTALRAITLRVASKVIERTADLFCKLRNELTAEDLRRNASLLQQSPVINTLVPYTLASLEGLSDAKSMVQILEMIHKLLPHVAAINLLIPAADNTVATTTTGNYYTWVESEHPYKQATVTNMRVLFPPNVSWIVLEMDPRSITAQPEDTLTIYAATGVPKNRCHCTKENKMFKTAYKKRYVQLTSDSTDVKDLREDGSEEAPCMHYNCTYVAVTPKLANVPSAWPQKAIMVPGNEVVFSLDTASDYLNEYNNKADSDECHFGFRCLCVGYENLASPPSAADKSAADKPPAPPSRGLVTLEMELCHSAAAFASALLDPDLDVPLTSQTFLMDMQKCGVNGGSPTFGDSLRDEAAANESLMLARGLELATQPTIHQVLEGQALVRATSAERQFLCDFVAGAESTAGGRLALWLSPVPRVDPTKCELKHPGGTCRPSVKVTLPVLLRDQYGDTVASPSLRVEVIVQKEEGAQRTFKVIQEPYDGPQVPDCPYEPVVKDSTRYYDIVMMKEFEEFSTEELRWASAQWGGNLAQTPERGEPAERLLVRTLFDGVFAATWIPKSPGTYNFVCTLDEIPIAQELKLDVAVSSEEEARDSQSGAPPTPPAKIYRFITQYSAGLRIRASPSLQAEELGRIPAHSNVSYVEELQNKDGTWVRLSPESIREFADSGVTIAWCLQYHRHLEKALMAPSSPTQADYFGVCSGRADMSWLHDEDDLYEGDMKEASDDCDGEELPPPADYANDSDGGSSEPTLFEPEPSKREREMRNEAAKKSPRRLQRRSNGNGGGDEWWTPEKYRTSGNNSDNSESDRQGSRVAAAGTQTSPDSNDDNVYCVGKDGRSSPRAMRRARTNRGAHSHNRSSSSSSPPTVRPAPRPSGFHATPKKHALSPTQAESVRAIFSAMLWHQGIVHDAIACATFLKFHPKLTKQGTQVVTRRQHESKPQRHSVEVTGAGPSLSINPATLEALTRSGVQASTSRARRVTMDALASPIHEEDTQTPDTTDGSGSPTVVSYLPPALRALVALWDTLSGADPLASATDKYRKEPNNSAKIVKEFEMRIRLKRGWRPPHPLVARCELCAGATVAPPLGLHMRKKHPGCRQPTRQGYDREGDYMRYGTAMVPCGQLTQRPQAGHTDADEESSNMMYSCCEKCREKAFLIMEQYSSSFIPRPGPPRRTFRTLELIPEIDYNLMRENAMFLLDLAPMINSGSNGNWLDGASRSPAANSLWQPAPPFQCLGALGAAPRPSHVPQTYYSLGRPQALPALAPGVGSAGAAGPSGVQLPPRFQRSLSVDQAKWLHVYSALVPPGEQDSKQSDPADPLADRGLSLLTQPSPALQRLISGEDLTTDVNAYEPLRLYPEVLMDLPAVEFVVGKRDLHALKQKIESAVRINTVRQYAFESLNWLLRSVTQPTSVHDVMWWFCVSLEKFARFSPSQPTVDNKMGGEVAPSTRALCPGGRAARMSRGALHAFLGSVSALAPSLPPAGASALQAVRCWAMHYTQHDRAFLHRSQVFSVISKILSHPDEGSFDDGNLGHLNESFHSYHNKDSYVWMCPDVTGWCDVTSSSRQGMAGALTDGSTETFWESGDEDRNKPKWVQLMYPGGSPVDQPHLICLHIDNTRDTANKAATVSFLYSGLSNEMVHMQDIDVDSKNAAWISYALPKLANAGMRVRCEIRGGEAAVRVRQVRALGAPVPAPRLRNPSPQRVLHAMIETDTLRVFRLLTSQVFGKLLEWGSRQVEPQGASEDEAEGAAPEDDSDLREHVVGILFAAHQLTSLQSQVMSHIEYAIGAEANRAHEYWESGLSDDEKVDEAERVDIDMTAPPPVPHQDNYCFEMLSLLLALSGSAVGRVHLAQRSELLPNLLALLHTGSERVQRQVIALLRRIIAEIPPQKMFAALNYEGEFERRITLLDHLITYLGKAINLQLKVKGAHGSVAGTGLMMMGESIQHLPAHLWFVRGKTTKKHAHMVAKLLSEMAEDKVSNAWGAETRAGLIAYATQIANVSEEGRRMGKCVSNLPIWHALAALCVCEESYLDIMAAGQGDGTSDGDAAPERPFCANHDDGATVAVVECHSCGPLCSECDRCLHLNRAMKMHHRQICKEEERAIRIDIHEGCGRAKMFWLLILVDRRTLKALAEFRSDAVPCGGGEASGGAGRGGTAGACRFCGARSSSGLLAIGNVCADLQCQDYGKEVCTTVLACGHACGGVRNEPECLPCLMGCSAASNATPLKQDADDMCMICFTDPLQAAPAIQLTCGHVFHLHCCKNVLINKWIGPRVTFSFAQCPICKEDMSHWTLEELLAPIRRLRAEVSRKALMRLQYEGTSETAALPDAANFAMDRYAYYVCHKCQKAYFGGLARCEVESNSRWDPGELVCGACSDVTGACVCPKHGTDLLEYKCRYCCSVAVFFCFGTSHFCNACHDDFQRITSLPKQMLPQCPAGPKAQQLPGTAEECPLHVEHPPTGEEFALGCGVCRHAHIF